MFPHSWHFPPIVSIFTCPGFVCSYIYHLSYHLSWLPDHWNGPFLSLGEMTVISYSKPIFSAKLPAVVFFKADLWIGHILGSWIPGLWNYFPGSLISGSWTLASHGVLDLAWIVICLQSSLIGSKSLQDIRVVEILYEARGPTNQ